ncbi:MAG: phosphoribosylformylglycinamidine synthase subunit PurL [Gemmataceae bacterium]|nr:phosphoribosylformylglycinamidine synthase subunit PurL [Gemmataceae bacterium]MDW8265247.1 phosphoribosylformylglycinamidine synthase subunit PurL [Gemmataceae bacterium]
MLWEVDIRTKGPDLERQRVAEEYDLLTHTQQGMDLVRRSSRGYLLEGDLERCQVEGLVAELLIDPLVELAVVTECGQGRHEGETARCITVLLKPGVMDPVAESVRAAARELGFPLSAVRTFRRYELGPALGPGPLPAALARVVANAAIEELVIGPLEPKPRHATPSAFRLVTVPLRHLDDQGLLRLSRDGQLALSLVEMQAIQAHFRSLDREPTDIELETLAQTWSEHCSHKTLKGPIDLDGRRINGLLQETIFAATREVRRRLGPDDWCVSVFADNAGIVRFDDHYHVCFKVETHNHPSAIEPYGGANTGVGGVIRDPLGTGLGAKPICNTDVFCFAPPDTSSESLPPGVLHPRQVMRGVVAGVRDYGNRMGIPTVNGAVCFDDRYLGNPLVFCGTVGLIPADKAHKEPKAGDLIVAVGGRTGRDGIHGATFSSLELTSESETVSSGAVQIGNAITEKKMLDVLLQARDRGLYHAITDCGAGGFSSAIGEMAEKLGAVVQLDQAPLKYEGLTYTEIWISEAQERMILAVPPERWPALQALCASEDVEAAVLGRFEPTGRLRLRFHDHDVGDLDLAFLHGGRPPVVRRATAPTPPPASEVGLRPVSATDFSRNYGEVLLRILGSWNVCSKEWIIRQYDHEVQGGSVLKPLVGANDDGPGDAAVIMPVLGSWRGLAVGCGINPRYGDLDPYAMALAVVDEAVRNVVAVGADPSRVALLDNFCWASTERPEQLGALVRAAEGCRDAAVAYLTPFISGKDSLNNEFHAGDRHLLIPPTLLISALGQVPDVRRCVSMDLKEPGNLLFLVGATRDEMAGSHYQLVTGETGGRVPRPDLALAPALFRGLHRAIHAGLVRSCHDLSEGGLAVAIAEMAFAGGIGAELPSLRTADLPDHVLLFGESCSRFLIEVRPEHATELPATLGSDIPLSLVGRTVAEPSLRLGHGEHWLVDVRLADLKEAWQRPLRW